MKDRLAAEIERAQRTLGEIHDPLSVRQLRLYVEELEAERLRQRPIGAPRPDLRMR